MANADDKHMENLIKQLLESDHRVDTAEVDVFVRNGVVYLSGSVGSAAERHAMQANVQSVDDVRGVVDRVSIRGYVKRDDAELAAAVRHAIERNHNIDSRGISVEANDAVIRLQGRLPNESLKKEVEEAVWWVPGVIDVQSSIEVADDAELGDQE